MNHESNLDHYIETVARLYNASHKTAFLLGTQRNNKYLLRYNYHLFSMWYNSTLVRQTVLSPANLFRLVNENFVKDGYLSIISASCENKDSEYRLNFTTIKYSLEDHPAADDFRVFLEYVSPGINLTKENKLNRRDDAAIIKKLYINDSSYANYFLSLSIRMGLLKKVKSVNVNRYEKTDKAIDFSELSGREILRLITEESIVMCADNIKNMIPGYTIPIDRDFIEQLLKHPLSTSDIISKMYKLILRSFQMMLVKGVEFEVTSPYFDEPKRSANMSEQDIFQLFISGSYVLNSLFDKYFFATFGGFLKFIEPFYDDEFTFRSFPEFAKAYHTEATGSGDPHFYLPCCHYTLTPLGREFYNVRENPEENIFINTKIPLDTLFDIVIRNQQGDGKREWWPALVAKYAKPGCVRALRLKISSAQDKNFWKLLEISDFITLEQLHNIICDEFFLEPSDRYYFNTDISMNPFTSYTPASSRSRHKKTDQTRVRDLPLAEKSAFYYCIERALIPFEEMEGFMDEESLAVMEGIIGNELYSIEIIKIKNPTGIEVYPQVLREGTSFMKMDFFNSDWM